MALPDDLVVTSSVEGDVGVLTLVGEVDLATCEQVVTAIEKVRAEGCGAITIDMAGVPFLDSSGLNALLAVHRLGATLTLRSPVERVRRLLDLIAVDGVITVD